ncbi:MAG TPA: aminopeptidase N [Nocardioidaceae bacterium]|nr:aminopeptidase N [Nocardioidaceae bacterium]
MPSLTLAEAQQRAGLLVVDHYTLELDLTRGSEVFTSTTTVRFSCHHLDGAADASSWIDVQPRGVRRAVLNDQPIDVDDLRDGRLPLRGLGESNTVVIEADMAYSHDGEGLHRAVDPADDRVYLYAMSFLDAAPRIFACFDQPDLKAPYDVAVTAPADWTVVGNGAATRLADGRWRLATTQPLSTYLVTLVAGPYHSVRAEHDGISLGLHVKQSLAAHLEEQAEEILTVTAACFDEYHRLFGIRYPFGDYHQAFVPEFNAGAMENPGCVTFRDSMVLRGRPTDAERSTRANTIAHEMAHQWFGNLVTMQWWDDLWLNESFAEYMGYRVCDAVTDFRDGWVEQAYVRNRWGMVADERSTTHPVAGRDAVDAAAALANFDGISYAKGASVLKQLRTHIGDEIFIGGVVLHLRAHAFGNATFADLLASWADAGAQGLGDWAEQWLRTCGADTISVEVSDDAVWLRRTPPAAHPSRRPHTLWAAAVDGTRSTEHLVALGQDQDRVALPAGIANSALVVPDAHDDTWAKVRLDPHSVASLAERLPTIESAVTRGVVWNSLRFGVDDAEVDPHQVLGLLEHTLPAEEQEIAVGSMLRWARTHLVDRYLPGEATGTRVARLASRCLDAAAPGSSRQIVAARAVASCSVEPDALQGWLDGTAAPDGLQVDADLRWMALTRLSELGAIDEAMIDTEHRRDPSAQGAVHAARCRAALPSPAAKQRAWEVLVADSAVSNYVLYATAEGFWNASQDTVTAPYVSRYFTEMPATSRIRNGWVVSHTVRLAFPLHHADTSTLRLAEAALEDEMEPGVRRALADGTDDLRRAVRVRQVWGR